MMNKFKIALFLVCICGSLANAFPKDKYEQRKKEGIRQLKTLIAKNKANQLKGLIHKNWYIFSDKLPIEEVGYKFFFKDNQIIQKLNEKIRAYNDKHGFSFYVKLNGFEMVHVEKILKKLGLPDIDTTGTATDSLANTSEPVGKVYASVQEAYKNYYKNFNRITAEELAKTKKYESNLTSDIFNAVKLGTYGALLSVTGLYYYSESENEQERGLSVEYEKSIALGLGFLGDTSEQILKVEQDTSRHNRDSVHYNRTYTLDHKILAENLENPLLGNLTQAKFMFSVDPDQALTHYITICMAFLKESEVKHVAQNEQGYNVIYLINVWDKIPRGKIATKELENIVIRANNYLDQLRVNTRVVLYEGDPKKFDYASLTQHEGVAFIGARKKSDTKDFVQAIENLGGDNITYVKQLRKSDQYGNNFENSSSIIERSTIYHVQQYNRIALHYARMNDPSTQTILGAGKNPAHKPLYEALAFSLIHGAGHNAEKDPKQVLGNLYNDGEHKTLWNHYATYKLGIMQYFKSMDKNNIKTLVSFSNSSIPEAYEEVTYYLWEHGGKVSEMKHNIKKDLQSWAYCTLSPQRRREIIIKKPQYFPNEAYFYSMQDHFGKYKPYTKRANVRFVTKK